VARRGYEEQTSEITAERYWEVNMVKNSFTKGELAMFVNECKMKHDFPERIIELKGIHS
jgi:hypothetical protein